MAERPERPMAMMHTTTTNQPNQGQAGKPTAQGPCPLLALPPIGPSPPSPWITEVCP